MCITEEKLTFLIPQNAGRSHSLHQILMKINLQPHQNLYHAKTFNLSRVQYWRCHQSTKFVFWIWKHSWRSNVVYLVLWIPKIKMKLFYLIWQGCMRLRDKHLIMSEEKLTKICEQALKTFMRLIVAPFFLFILINWPQIMDDGAVVIVLLWLIYKWPQMKTRKKI